jgi:hypothetical protein
MDPPILKIDTKIPFAEYFYLKASTLGGGAASTIRVQMRVNCAVTITPSSIPKSLQLSQPEDLPVSSYFKMILCESKKVIYSLKGSFNSSEIKLVQIED